MDSQNDADVGCSPSWSPVSNWTVAGGCLDNTVAYESFYSPINDEETVESGPKSLLVLRRPSSESGPCEITREFRIHRFPLIVWFDIVFECREQIRIME